MYAIARSRLFFYSGSSLENRISGVEALGAGAVAERPIARRKRGHVMPRRDLPFTYIPPSRTPITCPHCGANARLIWHSPLPADLQGEMRTFQCKKCRKQTKTVVQD